MKLIEQYGYTSCISAGGPWEDVIEAKLSANDLLPAIRRWCDGIQRRVAKLDPPRNPAAWRFTVAPDYIQIPPSDGITGLINVSCNRWIITEYHGEGEYYRLIAEKEA